MDDGGIEWPELVPGVLIRRYKRFLADILLEDGATATAHCPNSGAMASCCEPGRPVYLSVHNQPHRRLKYTWELIHMPGAMVGVNALVPNRLVQRSIAARRIRELDGYRDMVREVVVSPHTRLDLRLTDPDRPPCYVEIKNCTLVTGGRAMFPDAVTKRGLKHLEEMTRLAAGGSRCVMFYLIQRTDARRFEPADHIDPAYGKALRRAVDGGVEILAWDVAVDLHRIALRRPIPVRLSHGSSNIIHAKQAY
ncbi:MAG: DNA/RNA nuclease SfsA [Thermodesulfobacteriota bacterium]